jgi:soluble P-type ATPase
VISQGYKLEFVEKPQFLGIKSTRVPAKSQNIIKQEIISLLEKNVIDVVDPKRANSDFYSTLF